MGTDKRFVLIDGVPIVERVLAAVRAVTVDVLIACQSNDNEMVDFAAATGARTVFDGRDHAGPLAGLEVALGSMSGTLALVVAADMPWLAVGVLRHLVDVAGRSPHADAVAIASERGDEPLLAVYRRQVLPEITRLLDSGEHRAQALLDELSVRRVQPVEWRLLDPAGWCLRSVNEPSDLVVGP